MKDVVHIVKGLGSRAAAEATGPRLQTHTKHKDIHLDSFSLLLTNTAWQKGCVDNQMTSL